MLSLGEFDFGNFRRKSDDVVVWLLFILSTFIVQILFLNLLIAAMGDTYDKVKDTEHQSALKATIQLMSDYAVAVSRYTPKEQKEIKYVYTIQRQAQGEEELGDWEGKLKQLKRHFNFATDNHNLMVTSKVQHVDDKLRKFQEKFIAQSEKVDKL